MISSAASCADASGGGFSSCGCWYTMSCGWLTSKQPELNDWSVGPSPSASSTLNCGLLSVVNRLRHQVDCDDTVGDETGVGPGVAPVGAGVGDDVGREVPTGDAVGVGAVGGGRASCERGKISVNWVSVPSVLSWRLVVPGLTLNC